MLNSFLEAKVVVERNSVERKILFLAELLEALGVRVNDSYYMAAKRISVNKDLLDEWGLFVCSF